MTLTFDLFRDIIAGNVPAKFEVCNLNGSTVRALTDEHTDAHTHTHTHTDRTDFIPSTADAGGNDNYYAFLNISTVGIKLLIEKITFFSEFAILFLF